jgi:hypothetical protein
VNLLDQVCRSDRTGVKVQSNEHERAVMVLPVFAYVLTLHESHVGTKRQRLTETGSCAAPANLGVADETISPMKPLKSVISDGSLIWVNGGALFGRG